MPKLLQISIEVNSGSVGRIAEYIGKNAINNGWDSYITYARNNMPSSSKLIKIGTMYDVYKHGILTRVTDKHAFYSSEPTRKLVKEIQDIKPDIIHLHHLHGYFINIEILFNFLSNADIPIVWTFHDCWSFTGHCSHFENVCCNKWLTGCFECPQKKVYPASYLIDRSKENYSEKKHLFNSVKRMIIVPVSFWLGDLVKQSFLKKYPMTVIQNGIDLEAFKPSRNALDIKNKFNLIDRFIILGVASTWTNMKGLNDFMLLNKLLNDDEIIILVGLSKKQIKSIPSNILCIERTESIQQLAELYSIADVFINPTYADSFPTTNLEAIACGTPVITYNTEGSPETIDKKTGIVIEKGSIDCLVRAIQTIKSNGKEAYSNDCRIRAMKFFEKQTKFKEYLNLYNDLLSNK